MKKSIILSTALLSIASTSLFADSLQSLSKDEVIQKIQGNTITTIPVATINDQLVDNTFIGYFTQDGKVQAKFSKQPNDRPQSDEGTWMVNDDGSLCVTWQHWNNNQPVCLFTYSLGNGLLFVNKQTKKFESFAKQEQIKSGDQLMDTTTTQTSDEQKGLLQ